MDCVILAGGLGKRMRPLTDTMPKNLLPVLGEPFANHQLSWLADHGVKRVLYCIAHMGQEISNYVGDGRHWNLRVDYADEGPDLQGTAGALRSALRQGRLPPTFFVLYGDSYLPVDFAPVWEAFNRSRCPALMTVFRNKGMWDTSNVIFEDDRVVLYDKNPVNPRKPEMHWIDYGLSVLDRTVIRDLIPETGPADLADVYHRLSISGCLAGFETFQRFFEVGSPAGLIDLECHLRKALAWRKYAGASRAT